MGSFQVTLLTLLVGLLAISFAPVQPQEQRKEHVLVWNNLTSFFEGGWFAQYKKVDYLLWGPGTQFAKPSSISPSYQHLDSGVTGNGVWTGSSNAKGFYFRLALNSSEFEGITEATLRVKYYFRKDPKTTLNLPSLHVYPCTETPSNQCGGKTLERSTWAYVIYQINVEMAIRDNIKLWTFGESTPALLDEVVLNYVTVTTPEENPGKGTEDPTEDDGTCNESVEFKGIDCHNYYSCVDYSYKEYYECPEEDGLAFNPEIGSCDELESVKGCAPEKKCVPEYRPDPENCKNYFFCTDSCDDETCQKKTCPGSLKWSVDFKRDGSGVQQCALASKVVCGGAD